MTKSYFFSVKTTIFFLRFYLLLITCYFQSPISSILSNKKIKMSMETSICPAFDWLDQTLIYAKKAKKKKKKKLPCAL